MNGTYYRLLVIMTIKHPQEAQDVVMKISRTLPFQPVEGMTLVITNDESEEYELTLGPPRYEFAESAFVEYQEDETLLEYMRAGDYCPANRDSLYSYYASFGFEAVLPRVVIEQRAIA
jgi:hypothetical protein